MQHPEARKSLEAFLEQSISANIPWPSELARDTAHTCQADQCCNSSSLAGPASQDAPRQRYIHSWKVGHRRIDPQRCTQGESACQKTPCSAFMLQLRQHMYPKRSDPRRFERPLSRCKATFGGAHNQRRSRCIEVARSAPWRRPCQCLTPMRHPHELSVAQAQPPSDVSQESES